MPDTFTPNLNLDKPALSAFDIWGAKFNSNMDLIDAASITLRGTPVSNTAPTTNQVLTFNGTSWAPAAPTGGVTGSGTTGKLPKWLSGTSLGNSILSDDGVTLAVAGNVNVTGVYEVNGSQIASSNLSDVGTLIKTSTAFGGDLSGTHAAAVVAKINGVALGAAPAAGQFLGATGAANATWQTANSAGDLTGSLGSQTVAKLRSTPLSATAPNSGQVLAFNGTSWIPTSIATGNIGGSGAAGQLAFFNGGSTISSDGALVWDNSSKSLGIGTASPAAPLHVKSDSASFHEIGVFEDATGFPYITVGPGSNSGGYMFWNHDGNSALGLGIHGAGPVLNIVGGNAGIGLFAPSEALDINGPVLVRGPNGFGNVVASSGGMDHAGTDLRIVSRGPDALTNGGFQFISTAGDGSNNVFPFSISSTGADAGGFPLANLGAPVNPNDAARKSYVDSVAQGLSIKGSVRALANSNVALTGTQTIDGVALLAGDRVLLTGQTNPVNNGIYVVAAGAWARSADMANGSSAFGAFAFVGEGAVYVDSGWVCNDPASAAIVGTAALGFTQFSGAGQIIAGTGLSKSGNTLSLITPVSIANGGTGGSSVPVAGQVLTATSPTASSWQAAPVTPPGGSNGQVQFNSGGSFGGASNFWSNGSNGVQLGLSNFSGIPANAYSIVVSGQGEHWIAPGQIQISKASVGGSRLNISVNNPVVSFDTNVDQIMSIASVEKIRIRSTGVLITGDSDITGAYKISGTQIASANLSDVATLIKTSTTLGGDLSGNLPNPTVAKVQGTAVSATAPSVTGQTLRYNGTQWVPAQLASTDLSNSASILLTTTALAGDLSGTHGAATVAKLGTTGTSVTVNTAAPPTTGQVLTATSATAAAWATPSGGGGGYATVVVAAPTGVAATDTANIQNAINSISVGTVVLREGLYLVNAALTLKARITLKGQGKGEFGSGAATTVKCDNAFPDAALIDNNFKDLVIEDIAFDFNGFSRPSRSGSFDIRMMGIRATLRRISVANTSGINIPLYLNCNDITEINSMVIENCIFNQGKATGNYMAQITGTVSGTRFWSNTASGGFQSGLVYFGPGSLVSRCIFRHNQDYTTGVSGSTVIFDTSTSSGFSGSSITNCSFHQETGTCTRAIQVNDGSGAGSVTIVGNVGNSTAVGSISVRVTPGVTAIVGNTNFSAYSGAAQMVGNV